jgi:hypothetical protein
MTNLDRYSRAELMAKAGSKISSVSISALPTHYYRMANPAAARFVSVKSPSLVRVYRPTP